MASKKIFELTPFGTVTWASLASPAKSRDPDKPDQYQVRIELSPEDLAVWQAKMKKHAENFTFKTKGPKLGISVNEESGKVTLLAQSQYKPAIFDAKNNKLDDPRIGNGSIVRINCALNVYDKGITLMLSQVQVKKLVEFSSGEDRASAFGETDGHVAEPKGFGVTEEQTDSADVDALGI